MSANEPGSAVAPPSLSTAVGGSSLIGARPLPAPGSAFRWSRETWGAGLRCRALADVAQHLFTTRQLQLRRPGLAAEAWSQALAAVGGGQLARVRQVHGRTLRVIRRGDEERSAVAETPEGDAIITNAPGLVLAVQVADCVPVLLADARSPAIAAVHAGWRGSVQQVARAAVEALTSQFRTNPSDLVVALGPSIGACCYTVGDEVFEAFRGAGASDRQLARWFTRAADGSLRLDLWAVNRDQLLDAGIRPERIHLCRLCTKTHLDVFESFRAEGSKAGRMAALIRSADI